MNTFQFIAIMLYVGCLFLYLYIFTNKFQNGWVKNIIKGKPFSNKKGYIDFRIFAVLSMGGMVIILKLIQDYTSK